MEKSPGHGGTAGFGRVSTRFSVSNEAGKPGDNEEPYLLVVYLSDEDPDARTIQKQLEENYSFVRVYFTDSWD